MNFPTSKDDATSLPNPTGTATQNNPDHGALHTAENAAIIAVETKVGTGSSVPASNTLLIGTGAGTSSWSALTSAQLAAILSDETGTGSAVFANTPTLITPKMDTINESTPANGVTVGGVNLKSGAISTTSAIATSSVLANGIVTPSKLATGGTAAYVSTAETTASTSYADLTTTTDSVTVAIGANGLVLLSFYSKLSNNTVNAFTSVSFAASGTNTIAASDIYALRFQAYGANAENRAGITHLLTGLSTGSTTFKLKYKVETGGSGAGTGTFTDRRIMAVPL